MPILTIVAIVIILGVGSLLRVNGDSKEDAQIEVSPDVQGEVSVVFPSPTPLPSSSSSPKATPTSSSRSDVSIKVETNTNSNVTSEKLVYPGAAFVRNEGNKSIYETSADGETVYNWYVSELEKRSFNIRNKVKTRANDKIKAVVSGTSSKSSLNVTIDQENAASKTQISLE